MHKNRKKKTCSRCLDPEKWIHEDTKKSDFYKDARTKDGHRFDCKVCHKQAKSVSIMRRAMEMEGLI